MMARGLIIAAWQGFKNKLHTMVLSSFVIALCTIGLGSISNFAVYLVLMGVVGLVMPIFNTPFTVLLQQKVEPNYLDRMFGVLNVISCSVMPMAMLFYGPAADIIDIGLMLIVTEILIFVQSCFMIANKVLVEAGKPT